MAARYVFAVTFRLDPTRGLDADPRRFETTVSRPAGHPDEGDDWLFFRDTLWRGAVADPADLRRRMGEALGVPVESVDYRRFEVDRPHYEALQDAIAANLDLFRADDVAEVVTKYLGSSVEVVDGPSPD